MSIRRAIPVLRTEDVEAARAFYVDFLGFEPAMEEPGFLMLRSPDVPTTQVIVAAEGAHDREVLRVDVSVEVDDVDAAHADAQARGLELVYPLTDEPWGIRRFFVRDPGGQVINVAGHAGYRGLVNSLYEAFNRRDIDNVLVHLTPDVAWARGFVGGHVHGHDELRAYWTQQWSEVSPHVTPTTVTQVGDRVVCEVHQVVRSLNGTQVLLDTEVRHQYRFTLDGRVARFDVLED